MILSTYCIERIAKKYGAKRISANAIKELKNVSDDILSDISLKVIKVSHHSNRLTILQRDVKFCIGVINDERK